MSIRISLDENGPRDFYTNLDSISGRVILNLNRSEQVGAVVVKLEGEARTALGVPNLDPNYPGNYAGPGRQRYNHRHGPPVGAAPGSVIHENHKVLYKVQQVFPDKSVPAHAVPVWLQPGQHSFRFRFKIPMNNACSDPHAMAQIGGLAGSGGFGEGPGIFGVGGIRVMDGSRQLLYSHVTNTLPPTLGGMGHQADVTYFVKCTIQRPGLLKENWRYQINFRLLPLEPPRPPPTGQEAYARRPFTFRPRTPSATPSSPGFGKRREQNSKSSKNPFFTPQPSPTFPGETGESGSSTSGGPSSSSGGGAGGDSGTGGGDPDQSLQSGLPPSVEMSARLPYPSILTVGKPLPLRIIARKLVPSRQKAFLTSLHVELIGNTTVRCQDLSNQESKRWVIVSKPNLSTPVVDPDAPVGSEVVLPASLWTDSSLPSSQAGMTPSFVACNLTRTFRLEIKLGLSWGLRGESSTKDAQRQPQAIFLPLVFSSVEVYSGLANPELRRRSSAAAATGAGTATPSASGAGGGERPPNLPPRRPTNPMDGPQGVGATTQQPQQNQVPVATEDYDAPPPSYEEATGGSKRA